MSIKLKISNVKCSIIYSVPFHWKKDIKEKCQKNNIQYFESGNILSIAYKVKLCIIQKKIKSLNEVFFLHVNLTGIRDFQILRQELQYIKILLIPDNWEKVSFKIDNICSSLSFPSKIKLKKLSEIYLTARYNIVRFPAVFIKSKFGTVVVFESGKVNILGCKTFSEIKITWSQILPYLTHASMSNPLKLMGS